MRVTGTGSQQLAIFPGIAVGAIVWVMFEMNRYITMRGYDRARHPPSGATPVQI